MTALKKPNKTFVFIAKTLISFLFHIFYRLDIKKKYHLRSKGPFIVVANHTSFFDSILIGCIFPIPLQYLAKEELFKNKFFSFIIKQLGAVPISRTKKNGGAGLMKALNIIRAGGSILLFPEGTRSCDNNLLPAKPGTGFIIHHSGVPVIPVFIKGIRGSRKKDTIFLRPKRIFIIIGEPVVFNSDSYENISYRVMEEIKKLSLLS